MTSPLAARRATPARKRALLVAAWLASLVVFQLSFGHSVRQIYVEDGDLHLGDFACYQQVAREFWFEGHPRVYRLEDQLRVLARMYGAPVEQTMPIGAWPTFLFVLLPFSAIGIASAELAYGAWMGSALFMLGWMLARVRMVMLLRGPALFLLLVVVLASDAFLRAVLLGQTSVGACALILWLYDRIRVDPTERPVHVRAAALALLLLSFKPPYLVIAAAILLSFRRWRSLAASLALVGVVTAALSLRLGVVWLSDYLVMMGNFSGATVIPEYRSAIATATMNVFRYSFQDMLGSHVARIASLAFLCASGLAWLGTFLFSLRHRTDERYSHALACAVLVIMLSLAPYSGAYEDLLMVPAVVFATAGLRLPLAGVLALTGGLFLVLDSVILQSAIPRELLWTVKVAFGVSLIPLAARERSPTMVPGRGGGDGGSRGGGAQRQQTLSRRMQCC